MHTETDLLALAHSTLGDLADRPALRVEDCARLLGVSRSAAYEAVRTGQIPSWRIGRRLLVPVAALIGRLAGVDSTANATRPGEAEAAYVTHHPRPGVIPAP